MQQSTVHGKYQGNTGYLLGNVDMGIREFTGMGYCVDNMQTMQAIKSQLMMSCGSCKKRLHKSITQMNRTNKHARQDDVMSNNGNDK